MDPFSFISLLPKLSTPKAVGDELSRRCAPHGFPKYAIGGLPDPANPVPGRFMVTNWPESWGEEYLVNDYGPHDPTVRAAMTMAEPFTVSDIRAGRAGFSPSAAALAVLDAGNRYGCVEGLIVPVFGPHGYRGIACLAGTGPAPQGATRAMLHMYALYAHNRMLELSSQELRASAEADSLTLREVEVLRHARNGLVDEEIAKDMAITVRTVRFHFDNAKKKLRSRNRAEAVATAVNQHILGQ